MRFGWVTGVQYVENPRRLEPSEGREGLHPDGQPGTQPVPGKALTGCRDEPVADDGRMRRIVFRVMQLRNGLS